MAQTARVTILMEEQEKVAITKKARAEGRALGEYIRRRVLDDVDPGVVAMLELVRDSTRRANLALEDALALVDQSAAGVRDHEAQAIERARREFAAIDFDALGLFDRPATSKAPRGTP